MTCSDFSVCLVVLSITTIKGLLLYWSREKEALVLLQPEKEAWEATEPSREKKPE
jgi:hypothetical protein